MIRLPNLTIAGLMHHAAAQLVAGAGGADAPLRAYLADADGWVTRIDVAPPAGSAGHAAVGAVLGIEMQDRKAAMAVLQMPGGSRAGGRQVVTLLAITGEGEVIGRLRVVVERGQDERPGWPRPWRDDVPGKATG